MSKFGAIFLKIRFVLIAVCVALFSSGAFADTVCTGATYYDAGTDSCVACPAGYNYNTESGKTDATQCQISCPAGTFVETAGAPGAFVPSEYTELEYIGLDGTRSTGAYIDTGLKYNTDIPNQNVKLYADVVGYENPNNQWNVVVGTSGDYGAYIGYEYGRRIAAMNVSGGTQYSSTNNPYTRLIHTLDSVNRTWTVYDTTTQTYLQNSTNFPVTAKNYTIPITIGGYFRGSSLNADRAKMDLYRVKIYNGDTLMFDGIPARRNSDGVVGLYDTVSGTFKTNATGTNALTAGPALGCVNVGTGYWSAASVINYGAVGTRTACPAGTYSDIENGASAAACKPCTGATFSGIAAAQCTACPAGYNYNTESGKTDATQCQISCPAGTWNGEYTELEYIETDGNQYIVTDYIGSLNSRYEGAVYITKNGDRYIIASRMNTGTTRNIALAVSSDYYVGYGNYEHSNFGYVLNQKVSFVTDYPNRDFSVTVGGVTRNWTIPTGAVSQGFVNTAPLQIFFNRLNGASSAASYSAPAGTRVYYLKIYESDALVRDFVPARRVVDGVVGMLDRVSGTFFANSGTGEFIAGPDMGRGLGQCVNVGTGYWSAASVVNFGTVITRTACPAGTYSDIETGASAAACKPCTGATYNDTTAAAQCTACPAGYNYNTDSGKTSATQCQISCPAGTWDGYTELEYITSTGTQYIDTGFHVDNESGYMVDATKTGSGDLILLGTKGAGDSRWIYNISAEHINLSWNSIHNTWEGTTYQRHTAYLNYMNDRKRVIDGIQYEGITEQLSSNASTYNVLIFAATWGSDTPNYFWTGRAYSIKITQGETLAHDFVPARRNSDGVVGMLDRVTNTFFTNSGTGEFIAGPDIDTFGQCADVGTGYWSAASVTNYGTAGTRTACINKPEHSEYSAPGTSAECPFACDDDYTLNNDTGLCEIACDGTMYKGRCRQLCPVGRALFHAGEYEYPLWSDKTDVPSPIIHIRRDANTVCYVYMEPGMGDEHGLKMRFNGDLYHAIDPR